MKFLYCFLLCVAILGCSKIPDPEPEGALVVMPYPSPADQRVNIHIENKELSAYLIQIFDPHADMIFEENVPAGDSKNSFSLDISGSAKGSYVVILKKNSIVYTKKFLKI